MPHSKLDENTGFADRILCNLGDPAALRRAADATPRPKTPPTIAERILGNLPYQMSSPLDTPKP